MRPPQMSTRAGLVGLTAAALLTGFAKSERDGGDGGDPAIYDSCTADDELTATITLRQPFAGFISAMSLPAFSMQSPSALEEFQDDAATNPKNSTYSTEEPIGTDPFMFDAWNRGQDVTLTGYYDYWGDAALVDDLCDKPLHPKPAR